MHYWPFPVNSYSNFLVMVTIPLPKFDVSLPGALDGKLSADGESVTGKLTIFPGVKIDGVAGSQATIGGVSSTVKVKDGKASFGGSVNILKKSYTFNNGEQLSLSASVDVEQPLRYTVKLIGSDTKPNVLKFDKSDSKALPKTNSTLTGSVKLYEDPLFKDAGILHPDFTKFKKWTQKVTVSLAATIEDKQSKGGGENSTASLTRTLEWALRPLFGKDDDKRKPKPTPPDPFPSPDPDFPWEKLRVQAALAALLCYLNYNSLPQIIQQIPKNVLGNLLDEISTVIRRIKNISFNVERALSQSQEEVDQLSTKTKAISQELETAESDVSKAASEVETTEAEVTASEEVLAASETAEATAAEEVATATAAEAAADASEAADWWTIIGAIASGAAIAAATAALTAAIAKRSEALKKKRQAQDDIKNKKSTLDQKKLKKKQAELKVEHEKNELSAKQEKLKEAKEKKQDRQDVKDVLQAAHVGIELIEKKLKDKQKK